MPDEPVPEADALEQDLPLQEPDSAPVVPGIGDHVEPDAPEADAIEQALPGPLLDEDEAPR